MKYFCLLGFDLNPVFNLVLGAILQRTGLRADVRDTPGRVGVPEVLGGSVQEQP